MAVTRRAHVLDGNLHAQHVYAWNAGTNKHDVVGNKLNEWLNQTLTNGERIVGTHYIDHRWVVITEDYGLGPLKPRKR